MRLDLKGLHCNVMFKAIIKHDNLNYNLAFNEMKTSCNFAELAEGSDLFDIYKTYHIINEADLDEIEDYRIKPSVGDEFFYENKTYMVVRVILYPTNTITTIISKVMSEVPMGQSLDEARASVIAELRSLGMIHGKEPKDNRDNKVVTLYPETIQEATTFPVSIPNDACDNEGCGSLDLDVLNATRETNNEECQCGEGCCDACGVQPYDEGAPFEN